MRMHMHMYMHTYMRGPQAKEREERRERGIPTFFDDRARPTPPALPTERGGTAAGTRATRRSPGNDSLTTAIFITDYDILQDVQFADTMIWARRARARS